MRVTRLEIFGFKSFVDRFVLNFDEDIIGIVGPNGCGKSNIVDSLRWVLGETHARQLRGTVLNDLIFNGCDSRRPLGMAEVSITIRPDEHWRSALKGPASGANGQAVAPGGPERVAGADFDNPVANVEGSPVLVSDGSEKDSGELQSLIPSSLREIPGLFNAAEIQLTRRLYRSGESEYFINRVPCRLRDMTELYRIIGLGSRGLSIVEQGEIGEFISKKPIERRELLEEAAGISGFRARIETAQRKLDRTSENLARLSDIIIEVERQVRVLRRQAKRAKTRNELKEDLARHETDLFRAKSAKIVLQKKEFVRRDAELSHNLTNKQSSLTSCEALQEETRIELDTIEEELGRERGRKDELHEVLTQRRVFEQDLRVQKAKVESRISDLERNVESLSQKRLELEAEIANRRAGIADKEAALSELESSHSGAKEYLDRLVFSQSEGESEHRCDQDDSYRDRKQRIAELSAETEKLDGLARDIQKLEALISERIAAKSELQERISVERVSLAGYETEAQGLSSQLEDLARQGVESNEGSNCAQPEKAQEQRVLVSRGEVPEQLQATVSKLLAESLNIESLLSSDGVAESFLILTLSGDSVTSWGLFTNQGECLASCYAKRIEQLEGKTQRVRAEIEGLEGESRFAGEQVEAFSSELAQSRRERDRLLFLSSELKGLIAQQTQARDAIRSKALEMERAAHLEVGRLSAELAGLRGQIDYERRRIEERSNEIIELENNRLSHLSESELLGQEKLDIESRLSEGLREGAEGPNSNQAVQDGVTAIAAVIHGLEERRDAVRKAHAEVSQSVSVLRGEVSRFGSQHSEAKLGIERSDIELGLLLEDIQRYHGDGCSVPSQAEAADILVSAGDNVEQHIEQLQEEAFRLRRRLEREGEVDSESIDRYEVESKRLEDMLRQRDDLESASRSLERTIKQLKDISRARFVETFDFVKEKFSELVPRLFGGGAGHLSLINPEDPLTSGVELSVRPPGKRVSSMELLSGGEKALVAAAVLMSMFLFRPSPICVLDEVDAPLDDANLDRFISLIQEIAEKTQFLLITHNKQTMSAVDRLIGITMQERGVSKALSVSLEAAERELERWAANA